MKTANEILTKHSGSSDPGQFIYRSDALNAMEEYAKQFERKPSLKVSVRKRLPKVLRREAKRNASRKN